MGITYLEDKNIAQMDGGSHHSVVRTTLGEVYAFGCGDSGQLGIWLKKHLQDIMKKHHNVFMFLTKIHKKMFKFVCQ